MSSDEKRAYNEPTVTDFGSVTELTQTGRTNPGGDAKSGSARSRGN